MKELIKRMYNTIVLKRFRGKQHAELVIKNLINNGKSREEAIIFLYVSYVDVLLGITTGTQEDKEDYEQLETRS